MITRDNVSNSHNQDYASVLYRIACKSLLCKKITSKMGKDYSCSGRHFNNMGRLW